VDYWCKQAEVDTEVEGEQAEVDSEVEDQDGGVQTASAKKHQNQ